MRPDDLLNAMSEIDEDLIVRSDRKRTFSLQPMLSMVACFLLIVGIGTVLLLRGSFRPTMQVALFCDPNSETSQSFEQAAKEALSAYYGQYRFEYVYYKDEGPEARSQQVSDAVVNQCKLILLDGRQESASIPSLATAHPEIQFLILGIDPVTADQTELPPNVLYVPYRPEIAGYLAGYTAVKEGYTKLGYYYDPTDPSYIAYGSGYLQGIEAAAAEKDILFRIRVRVGSAGENADSLSTDIAQLDSWYKSETQMVLACGPQSCEAAKVAAQNHKKDVILLGERQAVDPSDTISQSIGQILDKIQNNALHQNSMEAMPYYTLNDTDGSWGFKNVSVEEFAALRDELINGTRPCKAEMVTAEEYSVEVLFS